MCVTLKDFQRYRQLSKEAERLRKQLKRLKECNNRRVTDIVKGSASARPYRERSFTVRGKINATKAIKRRENELADIRIELLKMRAKLNGFLKTIDDREIHDTLLFYYIDGCRYCDIAYLLGLEGDGSPLIRKAKAYVNKQNKLS